MNLKLLITLIRLILLHLLYLRRAFSDSLSPNIVNVCTDSKNTKQLLTEHPGKTDITTPVVPISMVVSNDGLPAPKGSAFS